MSGTERPRGIELRLHHSNKRGCAYYKPVDAYHKMGRSVLVNQTFVSEYFGGRQPENARLLIFGDNDHEARAPQRIALRYHHIDNGKYAYYKPVSAYYAPGPSVLVEHSLVSDYFGRIRPERLVLERRE